MSFHASATNIELEDGHILKATLRNSEGEEVDSELDLNKIIGNNDGSFQWGGENFQDSAEDIEFSRDERDDGEAIPVLRAQLGNLEGENVSADINLAERIANEDGHLVFI
ncbi:Cyanovirin-N like protein [Penicillium brasilianum]|uniref:Cyanovirin-N like protein n=1 Tax=Penicillium brasilianum TaxID=104259 RepID=A0A1S9RU54_PENBI|nr:Cyanovirin-N like protein [Penicillium brasilianum]